MLLLFTVFWLLLFTVTAKEVEKAVSGKKSPVESSSMIEITDDPSLVPVDLDDFEDFEEFEHDEEFEECSH